MRETNGVSDYEIIYDGSYNSYTTQFNVTNLQSNVLYSFNVRARNFNGFGDNSDDLVSLVCLPPAIIETPSLVQTTQTSIEVSWTSPQFVGGCPITSYELYRNDADSTTPSIQEGASTLANKPFITQYTVTGLTHIGLTYQFFVRAINSIGYVDSNILSVVLASVPPAPTTSPYQDLTFSNTEYWIKADYDAILPADNGGSPILGYQLWRDNGNGGEFSALYDIDLNLGLSFIDQNVIAGVTYRYVYRVRNVNGWSGFSPIGYLIAGTTPTQPL